MNPRTARRCYMGRECTYLVAAEAHPGLRHIRDWTEAAYLINEARQEVYDREGDLLVWVDSEEQDYEDQPWRKVAYHPNATNYQTMNLNALERASRAGNVYLEGRPDTFLTTALAPVTAQEIDEVYRSLGVPPEDWS